MPGTFRPSAGYAGRGVTLQSALEYMLYHQKSFAQVKPGTWRRAASQTFSPATRRFDCRQSQISARSRKYQPLPSMPCCRGSAPVSMLACALQVRAGNTAPSGIMKPSRASAASAGVSDPTWADVSPTTSTTTSGGVSPPRGERPRFGLSQQGGPRPRHLAGQAGRQRGIAGRALGFGQHGPGVGLYLELGCDGPVPELIERHLDLGPGRPERAVEIAVDRAMEMDAPGAVAREALDRLGKVVAVAATVTGAHLVEIAGLVEGRQTGQCTGVAGIAQFERA